MKFYNPFKPHIVEFTDGTFAVRKSSLFWWVYKGHNPHAIKWWMLEEYVPEYCIVDTLEKAKRLLIKGSLKAKVIHEA
mgnify:CR=1 FL=1